MTTVNKELVFNAVTEKLKKKKNNSRKTGTGSIPVLIEYINQDRLYIKYKEMI